jgi:hypothetical protein
MADDPIVVPIFENEDFEKCVTNFEKLIRGEVEDDETPFESEQQSTDIDNNETESYIPTSPPTENSNDIHLKSILLTNSRYGSVPNLNGSSGLLPKIKFIRFSPDTVFNERNLESQFWSKIEQERKRRRAARNQPHDMTSDMIFCGLQPNTRRGRMLSLALRKQNALKNQELMTSLMGVGQPARAQQSPPKCGTFLTSTAVGFRKSFSNLFGCFSPKGRFMQYPSKN